MKFLYNIKTPATPGVFMLYNLDKDHKNSSFICTNFQLNI
jgi:hypothetical protein